MEVTQLRTPAPFLAALLLLGLPGVAGAAPLAGDLDGDGSVGASDEALLLPLYGAVQGDGAYDPAADLDADGDVDVSDLARFGAGFGITGGTVDTTPPSLFVTLNDIPDNMNDLLVVPPDEFRITITLDSNGGSLVDLSTLVLTSSQDVGPFTAGTDLVPQFTLSPQRAVWEIPAGSDLARTAHFLDVSVSDVAGNPAGQSYGFAVRDFVFAQPLQNLQRVHLDFEQDRNLGPEIDFIESLRALGLSSAAVPAIEEQIKSQLVASIVGRVNRFYGLNADGSPGPDPVNIRFTSVAPVEAHSRICIGGQSPGGALVLGAAALDEHNLNAFSDECASGGQFGVFPHAIESLWGGNATYQAIFGAVDPGLGGVPIGEDPVDATVLASGFQLATASAAEFVRFFQILGATEAFARAVAAATAHEVGHMLGVVLPGPAPGGMWGGLPGSGQEDHNETVFGGTPQENFLMNKGASFTFEEITGLGGPGLPFFRPLNWAYLHDRIAPNGNVTGLFPPPVLDSVTPNPAVFGAGQFLDLTFHGDNFAVGPPVPTIELYREGTPTPAPVTSVTFVNEQTVTGRIWVFFTPADTYDVRFVNGDGQEVWLDAGLVVQ